MKRNKQNIDNFTPFTKSAVVETLLTGVHDKLPKYKIAAMYLSGSRLSYLNTADSDFDVYVFVQSSKADILNNKILTDEFELLLREANYESSIDVTVFDQRQVYKLLRKSNPNMLEILAGEPIWLDDKDGQLYKILSKSENQHYLREVAPKNFFYAVNGMVNNEEKALQKRKSRALKDLSLIVKLVYYLECVVNDKDFNVDMTAIADERPRLWRNLVNINELNYAQALECIASLQEEITNIKAAIDQINAEEVQDKQEHAQHYLEDLFINSIFAEK